MRSQTGKSPRTAFVYYYHIIIIISLAKDTHTLCNFSQHVISIHKNSTSLLCLKNGRISHSLKSVRLLYGKNLCETEWRHFAIA